MTDYQFGGKETVDYSPSGVYLTAIKAGYSADAAHALAGLVRGAHAAGVAEGIRQAGEAVQMLPCWIAPDGTSDFDLPDYHARTVVLDAIDALGTDE